MSFFENQMGIVKQCAYETAVVVAPGAMISLTITPKKDKKDSVRTSEFVKNSLVTAIVSASYFVSCISKYEILSLNSDNPTALEDAAFTIGSGIVGGFVYYKTSYNLDCYKAILTLDSEKPVFYTEYLAASVFMSTGYSLASNYIPRPYLTAAIFLVELGTAILPTLISSPKGVNTKENLLSFDLDITPTPEAISGAISGAVFSAIEFTEFFVSSYYFALPSSYANESIYGLENIDMCYADETDPLGQHTEL